MRKKIQDLAYARFEYDRPMLEFSVERLEFGVLQNESYQGTFSLKSVNGIPMRGVIYSPHPRMECVESQLNGTETEVSFCFNGEGLVEGDIQKGDIYIISNGGEYNLSFVASVTKYYPQSSIGRIHNFFDFANLAQSSFEEAVRIYQAPCFESILGEPGSREELLYRTLGGKAGSPAAMEEFLIGIRKKRKISFQLEAQSREYSGLTETVQESIRIKKDQWGWLEVVVSSDHPALRPEKDKITTQDFVGNEAVVPFLLLPDQLHTGKNYVRLTLSSLNQTEVCEICIHGEQKEETAKARQREKKELTRELARLYMDYRMKRMVTGVWSKETCICLDRLQELEPKNLWYVLYHAQALLLNKQRQEAEWSLDAFRREPMEKDSPLYGYYLYLCTLQEREPSYVQKLTQQIKDIYHKNQEQLWLFIILLFLDPELNNSKSRKLQAIQEKLEQGMKSPQLFLEAYALIRQEPYLLQKPGTFERSILIWAAREKQLTTEVVRQIYKLMLQVRQYHPLWYEILKACHEVRPGNESLQQICSFCIKWNLAGSEQMEWYRQGIQQELRIAGLYEAWLSGATAQELEKLPRTVLLYFQYQTQLGDRKQAMLYAAILKQKEEQRNLYGIYEKQIQHFAVQQLLEGRIDEHLAVLYQEVLSQLPIQGELAQALSKVMYTHKLVCRDPQAAWVIVVHHELKQEQRVALIHQQAYIQLYTGSYSIVMEDVQGRRFLPVDAWELQKLMNPGHYIQNCIKEAPECLPLLIHYFEGRKTWHTFQEEDPPLLLYLVEHSEITDAWKDQLKPQLIEYYYNSITGEALDQYLEQVDYNGLQRGIRNKLMELMIARGVYDKAYQMLMSYGSEQASISKLLIVAGQRIRDLDSQEDPVLLGLCNNIFIRGKYNEYVLGYLCLYFQGTIRELEQLWKAAREFELDTYQLEERFLEQLLFTEGFTPDMNMVFQHYFESHGREMLILAYLSYYSQQYIIGEISLPEEFFRCIEQQILLENPLNESCRLAYLRWSVKQQTQEKQLQDNILRELVIKHKYFAFYQELSQELKQKYLLHDRTFLEYRTKPGTRVWITYGVELPQGEMEYLEEELEPMADGIYVKPFVVFFGQEIPYYIKEEKQGQATVTESGHIQTHDLMVQGDESQYDIINGMMISYHLKDQKTLLELKEQYEKQEQLVKACFKLI